MKLPKSVIASVALTTLLLAGCSATNAMPTPTESASPSMIPSPVIVTDENKDVVCDADKMEQDHIAATDALNDAKADLRDGIGSSDKVDLQNKVDEAQAAVNALDMAIEICSQTDWLNDVRDQMTYPGHFTYFCELNSLGLIDFAIKAGPEYGPNSGANPKRKNTLDLSVPLKGKTDEAKQAYFWQNLCSDPFLGLVWGYVVGNLEIDGVRVFDIDGNDKLKIANSDGVTLDQLKLQDLNNFAESFLLQEGATDEETLDFTKKNDQYRYYVQTLIAILQQFKLLGVESLTSDKNWRLEGPSAGVANVVLSPTPDSLPSLLYGVTEKGQCEPEVLIGVNLEDMRPEIFNPGDLPFCQYNPPPPPETGCQSNCNPGCQSGCGLDDKTNHVPAPGTDNTHDSGTGTKPPAPVHTDPPTKPSPPPVPPKEDPPPNEGGDN